MREVVADVAAGAQFWDDGAWAERSHSLRFHQDRPDQVRSRESQGPAAGGGKRAPGTRESSCNWPS